MNIQDIYDQAVLDPSLLSSIDIDKLLENIDSETTEYLEGKTIDHIYKIIITALTNCGFFTNIKPIFDKLIGYRYIERVCEIRLGVYCRWIHKCTKKLESGGIIISTKICDDGIQVICKTAFGRHVSFRFDECIVFQKLTVEEQLILLAYEHIHKNSTIV
jgi:hypothetical protein